MRVTPTRTNVRRVPSRSHGPGNRKRDQNKGAPSTRLVEGLSAFFLTTLCFGGYIKGSSFLSSLPFDITSLSIVAVALLLAHRIVFTKPEWPAHSGLLLALYFVFLMGCLHTANWTEYSQSKTINVVILIPLCVAAGATLLTTRRARNFWLAGNVGLGLLVFAMTTLNPSLDSGGNTIIEGGTRITAGRALGAGFVALFLLGFARSRKRPLFIAASFGIASAMISTGARGPLFSTLAAVIFAIALQPGRKKFPQILAGTALLAALAWWLRSSISDTSRLATISDGSTSARSALWQRGWDLMFHHPLGIGWGNLYDFMPTTEVLSAAGFKQYAHNILIEIGSEGGWLALILFLILTGLAVARQRRAAVSSTETALLGLFGFFLLNAMVSSDVTENRGVWVAIGLALVSKLPIQPKRPDLPAADEDAGPNPRTTKTSRKADVKRRSRQNTKKIEPAQTTSRTTRDGRVARAKS